MKVAEANCNRSTDSLNLNVGFINMVFFTKYGHFISGIIQVMMYNFAAHHIMDSYLNSLTGISTTALHAALVIIPVVLVKFCETKYAQSFMAKG